VATQKSLYQYTADKYNDYRVLNNLGAIFLAEGNLAEARRVLEAALALEPSDTYVNNNLGYIALSEGDNAQAEKFLLAAGLDASKAGLGHVAILKGNYSHAVTLLSDLKSVNSGLAFLLTGNLGKASAALSGVDEPTAYYILAIIAARNNDADGVKKNIAKAAAQDVTWKEKAKKNIEFARFLPQIQ
jgi:tetratricopeptide (TPR) repeat protein